MAEFNWGAVAGAGVQGILSPISTYINNKMARENAKIDREENYKYNEMAADNADKRARAQYADMYSPQAQLKQIKEAGLSPSLMYGGTGGAGGATAPQGAGAGGVRTETYPYTTPELGLMAAQIANINADTKGKEFDNTIKDIEVQLRKKSQMLEIAELDLISGHLFNEENKTNESLMQAALRYDKYEDFVKYLDNDVNIQNSEVKHYIKTQAGQKTLQEVFKSAHNIDKEVAQIEGDKEYANLMLDVYTRLNAGEFAELSADERLSKLRNIVEQNNLEADKKETINKIFNGIENENLRSFLMVLYMLGDRYLGTINAGFGVNRGINTNANTSNNTSTIYSNSQTNSTSTNYNYNYKR